MGVARDNYARDGTSKSYVAGFAEVEVDVETGAVPGARLPGGRRRRHGHPPAQPRRPDARRRRCSGIGHAHRPEVGVRPALRRAAGQAVLPEPAADDSRRAGATCKWDALDIPDPETPVGARGVGEPPVGAGCGAVVNAISRAVGDEIFRRAPVTRGHDPDGARSTAGRCTSR